MKQRNQNKYAEIFQSVFEVEEKVLDGSFNFKDVEKWDSLTHLTLIGELEASFDVMFETDDILHFGGYENGKAILRKYGIDI